MLIFRKNVWTRAMGLAMTLAAATVVDGTARANLLTNGDFEADYTSGATGNQYCSGACDGGPITGWSTSQTGAYTSIQGGNAATVPHPNDMNAFIAEGSLSQTIATIAGDQYVVSFYLAADGATIISGSNPDTFEASFNAPGDLLDLDLSDTTDTVDTNFTDGSYTPTNYVEFTDTVTADSNSTTLTFTGDNADGFYYLDDVSVDPVPTSVPEPNSLPIFVLALLGFGAYEIARRRNRTIG